MTEPLTPNDSDELASAYLDGEATKDEIVVVEANSELLNLVTEHRAVQSLVSSPTPEPAHAVRAKHLASALAAFDELGASDKLVDLTAASTVLVTNDSPDDTVISLSERSAVRESRRTRSGMPIWLSAAAASIAVLGGVAYATTQFNGGNDDSAALDRGAEEASETTSAEAAADAEFDPAAASIMESPTNESMEDDEVDSYADGASDDTEDLANTGKSAIHDAEIEFPAGFPANEIAAMVGIAGFPIEESLCASEFEPPPDPTGVDPLPVPDRFMPVIVGDQLAELFIYGPESAVLVDLLTCQTIPEAP